MSAIDKNSGRWMGPKEVRRRSLRDYPYISLFEGFEGPANYLLRKLRGFLYSGEKLTFNKPLIASTESSRVYEAI